MLPGAVVSMAMGPLAGRLVQNYGPRAVLVLASLLGVVGMVLMTTLHNTELEFIGALVVANAAIATAYAAMPALLVSNVAPHETGIANSINSIMRTVGAAIGSALVITILTSDVVTHATPAGPVSLPAESAYVATFGLAALAFAVAAGLALMARQRGTAEVPSEVAPEPTKIG
jgi:MFS family permease